MAFMVQTLPPTAGANAYVTVADFRSYHEDRGRDTSASDDDKVQVAIIQATQYLDLRFEYVGYRYAADQSTEWPRSSAYDNRGDRVVGIPVQVEQATSEYAWRALSAELMADPDQDGSGRTLKSKSETVGPIRERVEYQDYGGYSMPAYPLADKLLSSRGLTVGSGQDNPGGLKVGNIGRS